MQITIGIEKPLIAGAEPSIHKSAGVGFRVIFVSPENVRALNGDFAALIGAEMIAFFVHDADAKAGANSHRSSLAMARRQRVGGHLMGRFGHPIGLDEWNAEQAFDFVDQFRRQRRAA
jgi:hypothetical protein